MVGANWPVHLERNAHVKAQRRYDGVDGPRVVIAHDYLTQRGGAEKVVLSMSRAFPPDAPIYTLLYHPAVPTPNSPIAMCGSRR